MKRFFLLLISLLIIISCVGCSSDDSPENVDEPEFELETVPRSTVYEASMQTVTESVTAEDGTELIFISVEYPIISNPEELDNVVEINKMYADSAQDYIDAVKAEFEVAAEEAYSLDPETFERYTFIESCEITYNTNCFMSIKRDFDENYGDFSGQEIYADVYDMSVGLPLYADEIITGTGEDVLKLLFLGFTSVAEEFPERFVDGYIDILNSAIYGTEFYLTDKAMVFVIQPGIATYPEYGCLMFEMPYAGNDVYFLKLHEK